MSTICQIVSIMFKICSSFKYVLNVYFKCFAEARFKLRKWATNSDELAKLMKLNESDTTETYNADDETYVEDSLGNSYTYRKVLSVNWNTTTEKLYFNLAILSTLLQN